MSAVAFQGPLTRYIYIQNGGCWRQTETVGRADNGIYLNEFHHNTASTLNFVVLHCDSIGYAADSLKNVGLQAIIKLFRICLGLRLESN